MKKNLMVSFLMLAVSMFGIQTFASAATFPATVEIPQAASANFKLFKWDGIPANAAVEQGTFDMLFDSASMIPDTEFSIFRPAFLYFITGASSGAGAVQYDFTYTDTNNPNGGVNDGLGTKAIATIMEVDGGTSAESQLAADTLTNVSGTNISGAQIPVGSFMKVYIALAVGNVGEPAAAIPFTFGDAVGNYTGDLVITASTP